VVMDSLLEIAIVFDDDCNWWIRSSFPTTIRHAIQTSETILATHKCSTSSGFEETTNVCYMCPEFELNPPLVEI
jgi:hypothetical protein